MTQATSLFPSDTKPAAEFDPGAAVVLHHGDAAAFLATVPDGSVQLVVTSPPYNIGKSYETRTAIADYLRTQERAGAGQVPG